MAFLADKSYVVIQVTDSNLKDGSSTIPVCLADGAGGIPALDVLQTFSVGLAPFVRGITAGGFNRVDSVIEYAEDTPAYAPAGGSEVERKAMIKLRTTSGKEVRISIPGINPIYFNGAVLDTASPTIAPILTALTAGIGGVIPMDSNGDAFDEVVEARKYHIKSLRS